MNLLKYGFNFAGGYLYDTKPTITKKIKKEVEEEAKKYESMLNDLQIPIDLFVYRLDEIMFATIPTTTEAPEPTPAFTRTPEGQALLDKLDVIRRDWNNVRTRYQNPHVHRHMSPKTYVRHMGHYRTQIKNLMKMENLDPLYESNLVLNEPVITQAYETAGGIIDELREETSRAKNLILN